MIEHNKEVNIKRQCQLLSVARSSIYYDSKPSSTENDDVMLLNEIRDIYQETPFYGYRRIEVELRKKGFVINHKKVQRLMTLGGIKAVYPTKRTTVANPNHKIFPYLLRDMVIDKPNQVWQVDITYIKIRHGFVYLICLIDIFSRKVMGWALSTFLSTEACLEALEMALNHGMPEIINSDQGCQFTSNAWIDMLTINNIKVSMDGKGRWADNVYIERFWRSIKYENVYLNSFDSVDQAYEALKNYIEFYNQRRPHQKLNYHTPDVIFNLRVIPTKKDLFEQFKLQNQLITMEVAMTPK
jgi:putative transposase